MEWIDLLATSYAPGHNFWPGSKFSWYVRGTLAFVLVAGPQVVAGVISLWLCLRQRRAVALLGTTVLTVLILVAWPEILGIIYRDGDRPWFNGLVLGRSARPWIALAMAIAALVLLLRPITTPRGFPIEQR